MTDITNVSYKDCTGCTACYSACPVNAIEMTANKEGFLYPKINETKCIHCGLCYKICPAVHPKYANNEKPDCYAVMGSDELRLESSSGGMFSIIAEQVLSEKGYVCGAAYDRDKITVHHKVISSKKRLKDLRQSKYIQSNIGESFKQIKKLLLKGKSVFFVGCPCQVAGLKSYLGKEYPSLLTADIVCHGVPSRLVFEKFISDLPYKSAVKSINFRQKKVYGWTPTMQIEYKNGEEYYKPRWECDYYKAFLSIMACRKSCGNCKFNRLPRQGDYTLADFWGIGEKYPGLDDGKGTSLVLLNNDKAAKHFEKIKGTFKTYALVDIELARKANWNVFGSSKEHWERDRFMKLIVNHSFNDAYHRITSRWFDVGIVGWWYGKNYGSALTYYALHEVVEDMGYDTLMLEWPWKKKPFPPISKNFVREFAKKHYNESAQYTFDEYPSLNNHIGTFIAGSDQLWNYWDSKDMGNYYMLDFVRNDRRKISYATSFGHPIYPAPINICEKQAELLKTFYAISVREDDGVKICRDCFGVKATQVWDPVFLCDKSKYIGLINEVNISENKPYLLAYVLSPDTEKGKKLTEIAKALNLELVIILDGQTDLEKNKQQLGIDNVKNNIGIEEWLAYIYNASYVITDSFHGICFSIIFEKQFTCILNKARGVSRFNTLLGKLHLESFAVDEVAKISAQNVTNQTIDYDLVRNILKTEVKRSYDWLKSALR